VLLRALLLFLFFVFLARAAWRLIEGVARGAMGGGAPGPRRPSGPPTAVKMAQCPVCGTYVVPDKAAFEAAWKDVYKNYEGKFWPVGLVEKIKAAQK